MFRNVLATTVLALALSPAVGLADVTYEEETSMGGLMKIATFGKKMKTKTQISGDRMRTETGDEATIVNLAEEKIYTLNTKKKTYSVMTFEEMRRKMQAALAQAESQRGEAGAESGEASDVTASADVRVSETGRSEEIDGYACKQYLMEMDVTLSSETEQQSGTMSTLMEMWLSTEVPGVEEIQAFHVQMANALGTTELAPRMFGTPSGDDAQSAQFSESMARMAEEMKKLDGFSMRSVMYLGDPEAARKEALGEKPEGGGIGGMFKKMTPFGGGGAEESGDAPGGVLMKMTTETKEIETKSIDPKVFAVPDGYRLVEAE